MKHIKRILVGAAVLLALALVLVLFFYVIPTWARFAILCAVAAYAVGSFVMWEIAYQRRRDRKP